MKKKTDEAPTEAPQGSESLEEEASGGSLKPSEELERAMQEAAEAIEARHAPEGPPDQEAEGEAPEPAPEGEGEEAPDLEKELEALRDRYVRLHADFDNFRRRALREREEAHQFGHQNLVKDLLPTVDNLERAIEHARQSEAGDLEGLLRGVELVLRELLATLAKHGLGVIRAEGEPFDPALHEAMAQMEDETQPPGTVVQVFQRGYLLRDRMIRPARVVVSKRAEEGAPGSEPEPGPPEQEPEPES